MSESYWKMRVRELEAENHKLKLIMQLHAGDCCSLNNEVGLFRGHWEDAEDRCDELQAKVVLAMSQNYCKICGNTLDGYVPPDVPNIEDRCNKLEKALKLTIDRWRLIGRKIWDTKVKVSIFELGRQLEKDIEEILKG